MAMQPSDIILSECFSEIKFHSRPFAARAAGVPCRRTDPEPQQPLASINAVGNVKPWMLDPAICCCATFQHLNQPWNLRLKNKLYPGRIGR